MDFVAIQSLNRLQYVYSLGIASLHRFKLADFVAIQSLHRLIHDHWKRIVSLHRSKMADFKAIQSLHRICPFDFYKHYLMTSTHSHGFYTYNNLTASFGILSGPLTLMVYICKFMASTGTFMVSSTLSRPILEFSVPHEHSNGFYNNLKAP